MATIDEQISAGSDDGYQKFDGSMDITSQYSVIKGAPTFPKEKAGVRFTTVNVPNGATIDACYISLYANGDTAAGPEWDVQFEDADDAATFTANADDIDDRSVTASVAWTPGAWSDATWYDSPSLVTPCQAVVNRGGWAANHAMAVIINPDAGSSGAQKFFRTFEYDDNSKGAKLHIEYTAPSGGDPPSTTMRIAMGISFR